MPATVLFREHEFGTVAMLEREVPLTDTAIKKAKFEDKPYRLTDGGGLYMIVHPRGAKYWRYDYKVGTRKTFAIGQYPEISLTEAREEHRKARALVAKGQDPVSSKNAIPTAASEGETFGDLADEYIDRLVRAGKAAATIAKNRYYLNELSKSIRDVAIRDLSSRAILDLLKIHEQNDRIETAHRLRATIGSVCRYAISQLKAENDPTFALRNSLRAKKPTPQAAITDPAKFGKLLRRIDERTGQPQVTFALKLMALCYPRPIECRSARWEHVDFKKAVWHIPAHIAKMRRPHEIPLSRQALVILKDLHALTGKGQLLFPSHRIITPISENAMNQALRRMGVQSTEHCSHGFRASASTILNSMGFDERVIEMSLAHIDPNQVRRAYNRSQYWEQRVEMAQEWVDICDRLKAKTRDNSDIV